MTLLTNCLMELRALAERNTQPERAPVASRLTDEQVAAVDETAGRVGDEWPVTVPDSFDEFQSLGYANHRPLRPLPPRQWRGVERRGHERTEAEAA